MHAIIKIFGAVSIHNVQHSMGMKYLLLGQSKNWSMTLNRNFIYIRSSYTHRRCSNAIDKVVSPIFVDGTLRSGVHSSAAPILTTAPVLCVDLALKAMYWKAISKLPALTKSSVVEPNCSHLSRASALHSSNIPKTQNCPDTVFVNCALLELSEGVFLLPIE